jgi:transposase, IS6 family
VNHGTQKRLAAFHVSKPRVITVDKNPAYPVLIQELKEEKSIPEDIQVRRIRYLNNMVEQDLRFIMKRVHAMLGFKSFQTATWILNGVEAMRIMKKVQIHQEAKTVQIEIEFIHKLFGVV